MNDPIGEIPILVTGDYSDLNDAIQESQKVAEAGGQAISSAFSSAARGGMMDMDEAIKLFASDGMQLESASKAAASGVMSLADATQLLKTPVVSLDQAFSQLMQDVGEKGRLDALAAAMESFGATAGKILPEVKALSSASGEAATSSGDLLKSLLAFGGITVGLAALKTFATDALEAYAAIEKATVAITALTGSAGAAESAISGLRDLALQDALSFPSLLTAEQRFLAFGVAASHIPAALNAIADTAAATGRGFDSVANTFERIIESGAIQSRTLINLGINMTDLAAAMGVTEAAAKKTFAALDQSERIAVLEQAMGKFGGTAAQVAQTLSGQWQNLTTELTFTLQNLGQTLAPVASGLIAVGDAALKSANVSISAFGQVTDAANHLAAAEAALLKTLTDSYPELGKLSTAATNAAQGMDLAAVKGSALNVVLGIMSPALAAAAQGMEALAGALNLINTAKQDNIAVLITALNALHDNLDKITHSSTTSGEAFQKAWGQSQAVATGINAIADAQSKANASADTAGKVYQAMAQSLASGKPLIDGHVATVLEVNRAYDAWQKALVAANSALKDTQAGVMGYTEALVDVIERQKTAEQAARDAYSTWKDLDTVAQDDATVMRAASAQWDVFQSKLKAAHMDLSDIVPALADTTVKIDMLAGSTDRVVKVQQDFGGAVGMTAKQIADATTITTGNTAASDAAAKSISIQGAAWGDLQPAIAAVGMAASGTNDDLAKVNKSAADSAATFPVIAGGWNLASAAVKEAKSRYDELNNSLQTGTELANGHIATVKQVQRAYEDLKNAQDAAKTSTDACAAALSSWNDQARAQLAAAGASDAAIKSLTGDIGGMNSTLSSTGGVGASAFSSMTSAANVFDTEVQRIIGDLNSMNNSFASGISVSGSGTSGRGGGRGGSLSGQLGFTGTPDEMRAEFAQAMATLDSASAWAASSGGFVEGIDAARQKLWQDLATSIANYYLANPQSSTANAPASSSGAPASSSGGTATANTPLGPIPIGLSPSITIPVTTATDAAATAVTGLTNALAPLGAITPSVAASVAALGAAVQSVGSTVLAASAQVQQAAVALRPIAPTATPVIPGLLSGPSFQTISNQGPVTVTVNANISNQQQANYLIDQLRNLGVRG